MNNLIIRFSIHELIIWIVVLNPLFALYLDNIAMYRYVVEPIVTILLVLETAKKRERFNRSILIVGITAVSVLYAFLIGSDKAKTYLHLFCYLNAVLFFYFMVEENNQAIVYKYLKNKKTVIKSIVVIGNTVELYMMINRQGYVSKFHWGGEFFRGTSSMPHTMSYLMLVLISMVIILIMLEKRKLWAIMTIIPFLAILLSGARITLVLSILLLMIIIDQVLTSKLKGLFFKALAALLVVGIGLYIFRDKLFNSSLWAKLAIRSGSGYEFTAGRNYMWSDMIEKYFYDSSIIQFLIGKGDDKTYYYNSINPLVHNPIWAHSDFLQILIGKGALGLSIYIGAMLRYFESILKNNKYIYKWFIILLIFSAALLNGFYSYRDTTMAIPLFGIIGFYYCGETKINEKRIKKAFGK